MEVGDSACTVIGSAKGVVYAGDGGISKEEKVDEAEEVWMGWKASERNKDDVMRSKPSPPSSLGRTPGIQRATGQDKHLQEQR